VTLMEPSTSGIKARVVFDTHAGSLDSIAVEQSVTLRRADGADVAPVRVEPVPGGGGHHRQAIVVFPAAAEPGEVRIVVKNVGGIAERMFRWSLPLAR